MRKIENEMNAAITREVDWKCANTEVRNEDGVSKVFLHGNLIAEVGETWLQLSHAGYKTATTKSRLNSILTVHGNGERIYQKNGTWFLSTNQGDVEFIEDLRLD